MAETEFTSTLTQHERIATAQEKRRDRRQRMGEKIASSLVILPEIDTAHEVVRDHLRSRVIGQDTAIDAIVNALDRSEVRSSYDNRPVATFAFLGPTGVGKTELATALAEIRSQFGPNLISINCGMYSHGHEVTTLTGAPPSYVGREQPPILTADRVEQEGTVILFDEIEKGAKELHNLLLHITDTGKLQLNDGTEVSFRDAVIILTSNLGSREMSREAGGGRAGFGTIEGSTSKDAIEAAALKGFSDFFTPEFVGRTERIVFHSLNETQLHQVIDVKLSNLNRDYIDEHGATVQLSDGVRERLVEKALSEKVSGVRPLVTALDKEIAAPFGRYVFHGHIEEGTEVHVYHKDELSEHTATSHKSEYIFTMRRNNKLRKKPVDVPPAPAPIFSANNTSVIDLDKLHVDD